MSGLVVDETEAVQKFSSIFAGVLHSSHSIGLLRGSVVKEGAVDVRGQVEFVEDLVRGVGVWGFLVIELSELEHV